MPSPRASRRTRGARLAVLWFLLSAALLVWPIYPWLGNHVHPRILGLPWSLVYVLLVIAVNAIVLNLLHVLRVIDDREPEPDALSSDALSSDAPSSDAPSSDAPGPGDPEAPP
ncbi:MAG: hypothetical protein KDK70_26300 [Myxococcales bacterium]|nr:hypothetical protein [Myxococcales bacterium]